jgi:hypothetical protein
MFLDGHVKFIPIAMKNITEVGMNSMLWRWGKDQPYWS